jgi:hypothetical protein
MWISRDNNKGLSNEIFVWVRQPEKKSWGFAAQNTNNDAISLGNTKEFKKLFPNVKLPRKGSCREILGLQILEK